MTNSNNSTSNNFSYCVKKEVETAIRAAIPFFLSAKEEVQKAYEEFLKQKSNQNKKKSLFTRLLLSLILLFCFSGCALKIEADWFGKSEKSYLISTPEYVRKNNSGVDTFERGR